MTAAVTSAAPAPPGPELAAVRLAGRGLRHECRAVGVVWQRELIRFWGDKARILSSFVQPLLFLFVLGSGLAAALGSRRHGVDYRTFMFPGVIATGVLFTAVFSAISIVWDREFGFLREMMVAPVARSSIVIGKCFGGATVATLQAVLLLFLGGLVDVPYRVGLIAGAAGVTFLVAFALTAFGLLLAVRVGSVQTLMPVVQLVLTPLMFLSGALYPLGGGLPTWLRIATRLNPVSYGVDAMRSIVFHYLSGSARAASGQFGSHLTWDGWVVPAWLCVLIVLACGLSLLGAACVVFSRSD